MSIKDFRAIREDGKVIQGEMTSSAMSRLGWKPSKVIGAAWKHNSIPVSIKNPNGILAKIGPGNDAVVLLFSACEPHSRLVIVNADGTERLSIGSKVKIDCRNETGMFCWFEPAQTNANSVGVVFRGTVSFTSSMSISRPVMP